MFNRDIDHAPLAVIGQGKVARGVWPENPGYLSALTGNRDGGESEPKPGICVTCGNACTDRCGACRMPKHQGCTCSVCASRRRDEAKRAYGLQACNGTADGTSRRQNRLTALLDPEHVPYRVSMPAAAGILLAGLLLGALAVMGVMLAAAYFGRHA